ncbi:MAG: MazG nucleotide pyrophosphohydrolase domain-containing protein [Nanoarchaeota archaeon]|nr:hypothetical protein [Nanoarchaeota archaeon]
MNNPNYKQRSLSDWTNVFNNLYGSGNQFSSAGEMWGNVVSAGSRLAKDLRLERVNARKDENSKLVGTLVNVPDIFAWMSAFSQRFGSLEEMTWYRFPGVCRYCLTEENCSCITDKMYMKEQIPDREVRLQELRRERKNYPATLDAWQEMFDRIYGNANRIQTLQQIGLHLIEEIGEVQEEINRRDESKIIRELPDVFAWINGVLIKTSEVIGEDVKLSDITWDRYKDGCPCNI